MLLVTPLPAFTDNYIWILQQAGNARVVAVDPGTAAPVQHYLHSQGLQLEAILLTHHHADHIGGVNELLAQNRVPVYGPKSTAIPQVSHPVREHDEITVAGTRLKVLEVPGHTLDHIAYFAELAGQASPVLFCGDTLFAAGCGRMFEGTASQMHASLQKLAALPPSTRVYCTHEYTLANLRFAAHVMPHNKDVRERVLRESRKREAGEATLPSTIALELDTNPFLRCDDPEIKAIVSARNPGTTTDAVDLFASLRSWKDGF